MWLASAGCSLLVVGEVMPAALVRHFRGQGGFTPPVTSHVSNIFYIQWNMFWCSADQVLMSSSGPISWMDLVPDDAEVRNGLYHSCITGIYGRTEFTSNGSESKKHNLWCSRNMDLILHPVRAGRLNGSTIHREKNDTWWVYQGCTRIAYLSRKLCVASLLVKRCSCAGQ